MKKNNLKGWLYLLPAILFLGAFMVYPLIDVFVYSLEEGYNSASQSFNGVGLYNYRYVLRDPYFLQALKNTFLMVVVTVPLSTGLALLSGFGLGPVDFIDGPYAAKLFVLCFYTIWVVLPFKILILTSALASVKANYYKAARVDGTSKWRTFARITLPMISPTIFYLVVTGFIGAFKSYSDAVALFGVDLNAAGMNTLVGYIYDMLYGNSGGYPSYASAAAILLFAIVLTITAINLLVSKKHVHY